MSEVKDGISLQPGDQVEFVLVTNQRTGKSSACNVTKVRLVSVYQYMYCTVWRCRVSSIIELLYLILCNF
jgi:''Cold-shock'' DNA-binding domain.